MNGSVNIPSTACECFSQSVFSLVFSVSVQCPALTIYSKSESLRNFTCCEGSVTVGSLVPSIVVHPVYYHCDAVGVCGTYLVSLESAQIACTCSPWPASRENGKPSSQSRDVIVRESSELKEKSGNTSVWRRLSSS